MHFSNISIAWKFSLSFLLTIKIKVHNLTIHKKTTHFCIQQKQVAMWILLHKYIMWAT
jgi:hypothetical protein